MYTITSLWGSCVLIVYQLPSNLVAKCYNCACFRQLGAFKQFAHSLLQSKIQVKHIVCLHPESYPSHQFPTLVPWHYYQFISHQSIKYVALKLHHNRSTLLSAGLWQILKYFRGVLLFTES